MSGLEYIREHYGVDARRGRPIRYTDEHGDVWEGRITGASGPHLKARLDGRKYTVILHPTQGIEYPAEKDAKPCRS